MILSLTKNTMPSIKSQPILDILKCSSAKTAVLNKSQPPQMKCVTPIVLSTKVDAQCDSGCQLT